MTRETSSNRSLFPIVILVVFIGWIAPASAQSIIDTVAGNYRIDGQPATAVGVGNPLALACDASGNLYAAVEYNHVFKIDTSGNIFVVAGNGSIHFPGDGLPATAVGLAGPAGVIRDAAGNMFISDTTNHRVRKVDPSGTITTVTGAFNPKGLALDAAGNLYVASANGGHRILKVDPSGTATTVAGTGTAGFSGDGGPATAANIDSPSAVEVDAAGNLYISDTDNHRIRKVDTSGVITTIVGDGVAGFAGDGGPAIAARLNQPAGLHLDGAGNLLIADQFNQRVRKVDVGGTITTVAGSGGGSGPLGDGGPATSAKLIFPRDVLVGPAGNLYIADGFNHRIRKVDTSGIITTIAGNGSPRFFGDGGPAADAGLAQPRGLTVNGSGELFIADNLHNLIRRIDSMGVIDTFAGPFGNPRGVTVDGSGNLYVAEFNGARVSKVESSGTITILAGTGIHGFGGDGGAATSASLDHPADTAVDAMGNLYIADWGNHRIRKVDASGTITTVAGDGTMGFGGDGGPATAASLSRPTGVTLDLAGDLYIADWGNDRIRKVDGSGTITTVAGGGFGGGGTCPSCGEGGPATDAGLFRPEGVAFDSAGNFYIPESGSNKVSKVDTSGVITTVAGDGSAGFSGDGGPATSAQLVPFAVAVDATGNLYIADSPARRVRRVTLTTKPTADAGPDQSIHAGENVLLDGSGSFDDNTATEDLLYDWSLTAAPAGSSASLVGADTATPSFAADLTGTYRVTLVVTDEAALVSDPDEVVVSSTNLAPTADAGADLGGVVNMTVELDGSGSTDPEEDPLTYSWTVVALPAGSTTTLSGADTVVPSFVPDLAGDYTFRLIVNDGFEDSAADEVTITVITGEEFVENEALDVIDTVVALPPTEVTTSGNQEAFGEFMTQVIRSVQRDNLAQARRTLEQAIERADGCALRGTADGNGPGRDWITKCATQLLIYDDLTAALAAISE